MKKDYQNSRGRLFGFIDDGPRSICSWYIDLTIPENCSRLPISFFVRLSVIKFSDLLWWHSVESPSIYRFPKNYWTYIYGSVLYTNPYRNIIKKESSSRRQIFYQAGAGNIRSYILQKLRCEKHHGPWPLWGPFLLPSVIPLCLTWKPLPHQFHSCGEIPTPKPCLNSGGTDEKFPGWRGTTFPGYIQFAPFSWNLKKSAGLIP